MTKLDVSDLAREQLPAESFPADLRAPFRLHLSPPVHRGMVGHAKEDDSVEICGVIVGHWGRDEQGPFALATDFIRCDNAASKFAEVTFTHESWAGINREMDTKYADKRIVGWYHSHPDFGIFLSERDCFIHEHFFNGAGQVAYVIDPVRDLEGVFSWQQGKPTPMSHFWIGNEIQTVQASQRNPARSDGGAAASGGSASSSAHASTASGPHTSAAAFPTALTLLGWIGLFLLGCAYADWRSRTEQRLLAEGAVAHYGYTKLMRVGLDQAVAAVRQNLLGIESDLDKLPKASEQLSAEDAKQTDDKRLLLSDRLLLAEKSLYQIQETYSLSKDEAVVFEQLKLIASKQAELQAAVRSAASAAGAPPKATPGESSPAGTPQPPKVNPQTSAVPTITSEKTAAEPPKTTPKEPPSPGADATPPAKSSATEK